MAGRHDQRRRKGQKKRKVSEMIWEFAGDFIRMAETLEQRRSRLNAACSAWNIACNSSGRERALDQYVREFQRFNPSATQTDLADVRSDMQELIQKKLEMFPGDLRLIVGAQLVREGDKERINAVSATLR